jgi:hypothetical protein
MESLDEYQRETELWRAVVGQAIVCFGEIELVTLQCLAHIPSDRISQTSAKLPFARRVELIIEILEGRADAEQSVPFIQMLKRAKDLAKTRNDIAHNPVMLNIFVHKATGDDPLLQRCIATARGGRVIDLAEAKEFAAEVEDLAASLWMNLQRVAPDAKGVAD